MLLRTDSCEGPDAVLSSPTVRESKCIIVSERNMLGEWQHRPPRPVHSCRLCFVLRLQYSRYAAIHACGAAGRIAASFQTSLASLILPLPNSDLYICIHDCQNPDSIICWCWAEECKRSTRQRTKGRAFSVQNASVCDRITARARALLF